MSKFLPDLVDLVKIFSDKSNFMYSYRSESVL
jgi:hypothetical protein